MSDLHRPKVFGAITDRQVGVIVTDPITGRTSSVRFDPKYVHQLALDLLNMADRVEDQ